MSDHHPDNAPYLGLRPYLESERDKFFGRDEEIHILTDKILAHRLTLLVAASGVGKSSLLQAGVMPALRASGMADLIYHNDWALDPALSLKQSIVKHFIEQNRIAADYQADFSQPLAEFLQVHALLGVGTVVVLLDQFEEFFYYHRFSTQRDEFVRQLATAIHDTSTPTAFVFSMREDFAMELNAFKPWLQSIFDNPYRIEKLSLAAARLAITEPIKAVDYRYEPELIDLLLKDLGQERRNDRLDLSQLAQSNLAPPLVEPPHLQIVCQQLWQHVQSQATREISRAHYQQLGTANGILKDYFKQKMAQLDREQKRLASLAFDLLVNQHGAKMAYPLVELASKLHESPATLQACLDQLQKAAILRRQQRQGEPWYELYHDIFAKSIVEWNQVYKRQQLKRKLMQRGGFTVAAVLAAILSIDGWQNHHDRYFRLGAETLSDQVEVYQGKADSWDIFHQRQFLYESDYERADIEADKRFATATLPDLEQGMVMQIGQMPLDQRFRAYAEAGLFEQADVVAEAILKSKNQNLMDTLTQQFTSIRTKTNLERVLVAAQDRENHNREDLLARMNGQAMIAKLLSLLDGKDEKMWSYTAALGKLNATAAIPKLITLLEDKNEFVRRNAAEALGKLNATAAIPKLVTLLEDKSDDVRRSAVDALRKLNATTAIPKLVTLLEDKSDDVRRSAVDALSKLNATTAIPKLITLLEDKDIYMRPSAATALGNLKATAAIPKLITLLEHENSNVLRGDAAEALVKLNATTAIPKLLTMLEGKDDDVRRSAVTVLVKLNATAAITKLLIMLEDKNEGVRGNAAEALGNLKATAAIPKLLIMLEDKSWVRISVAAALGQLNATAAIPKLITLLEDKDKFVRGSAVDALGKLKVTAAIPKLITLLEDKDEFVRRSAVDALGKLKATAAISKLITLLEDSVLFSAAQALGNLNATAAIPKLITLLKDEDDDVRHSAAKALGYLKATAAIPKLMPLLEDRNAAVREWAAWALGRTHATAASGALVKLLTDDAPLVQQAAAYALNRMQQHPVELLQWQTCTLASSRTILSNVGSDEAAKIEAIKAVRAVYLPEAAALLVSQLKSDNTAMLNVTLWNSVSLSGYHPEWLQTALPQMIQLTRHVDEGVQINAINALAALITFSGGQNPNDFKALDQTVQQTLLTLAQDGKQSDTLRFAAVDALGNTERDAVLASLLPLLSDEKQSLLHPRLTFYFAKLNYRPALPALRQKLDAVVAEKQAWRAKRDAAKAVSDDLNAVDKVDLRWRKAYEEYQYGYAVAHLAPPAEAVVLVSHPLLQVRRAATQALADNPSGAVVQALVAYHQEFDAKDLPSPRPYSTYRALDQVLTQLEISGRTEDLHILRTLKTKGFKKHPKQEKALNERFDWTIAELSYRLPTK